MRRLIGKAALAIMLTFVILLSSVNTSMLIGSLGQNVNPNQNENSYYLSLIGCPASITAGQSFSGVTVTVYNSNGVIMTNYTGEIYFTSTDPKATLPYTSQNNYTFTTGISGDNGVHNFSGFNLVTSGFQTITVTDGSVSATSGTITVNHDAPVSLQISPKTASITAGFQQAYTSTASDSFGNFWDVSGLTVWFVDSGAQGSWSGNVYTSAKAGYGP